LRSAATNHAEVIAALAQSIDSIGWGRRNEIVLEFISRTERDAAYSVLASIIEKEQVRAALTLNRHIHVNANDGTDSCAKCGRDLRDEIHVRMSEYDTLKGPTP
jgi:hypothetical protein